MKMQLDQQAAEQQARDAKIDHMLRYLELSIKDNESQANIIKDQQFNTSVLG